MKNGDACFTFLRLYVDFTSLKIMVYIFREWCQLIYVSGKCQFYAKALAHDKGYI